MKKLEKMSLISEFTKSNLGYMAIFISVGGKIDPFFRTFFGHFLTKQG